MIAKFSLKLLHLLPPELAHKYALIGIDYWVRCGLNKFISMPVLDKPTTALGIKFSNPLGLAAGLDKNADYITALSSFGFGFVEVGTLTPKPQPGNKTPRLFRLPKDQSLINRMGCNNRGINYAVNNMQHRNYTTIVGVNIGKNKEIANNNAIDDYVYCLRCAYACADYITVNISSPNTHNLRQLQEQSYLANLLDGLKKEQLELFKQTNKYTPLVIKISPDMEQIKLQELAAVALDYEIDGIIAANTTIQRSALACSNKNYYQQGGLSGRLIDKQHTSVVDALARIVQNKIDIIASGGVTSGQAFVDKLNAGAKLVQIYTGFIYSGIALLDDIYEMGSKTHH